ncbi:MAG: type II secretion system protein GspN [Desulfobacterales bacterium]|nr:type II secretion system protein GspN [Desulfobacterales bacterium]
MKPKILLYTLYVAAAVAVSLYVRFPGEPLRDYVTHRAEQMLPGLALAVADVRPALPAAIRFQGIEAGYQGIPALRLDEVRMAPKWGSMLRLEAAAVFKTTIGGGSLQGVVHRSENMSLENLVSRIEFNEIQLGELRILDELFDRRITGLLSGKISRLSESSVKGLEIQLQLTDAAIELKLPALQRDSVSVKQLQAEAAIVGGTRLQIKRCEFRGPEFDGVLAGSVELKSDFTSSVIDLQASAKPHTVFMAELKKIVPPQLLSGKGRGGTFSLQLSGTLGKPRYSFR